MVTLIWSIPLGEIDHVVGLTGYEGGTRHLGSVTFSERGMVAPGTVEVDLADPAAPVYIAKPWMFLLDRESGQRVQTICLCHLKS
jgi:hypothetical protein